MRASRRSRGGSWRACHRSWSASPSAEASADVPGAVDVDRRTGSVSSEAGGEKHHGVGNVLRLGDFAQRDVASRGLDAVLAEEGGVEARADKAGRHREGGNVVTSEVTSNC